MKLHPALIAPLFVAGCFSVPETTPGQVIAFNGHSVVIRGGIPPAGVARPNEAMVAQALEVCPGAAYSGAAGVDQDFVVEFDYTFLC